MLIRKFKENPGLKSNLSERAVVLDPDLIDLTMIPPPMTPDEVHTTHKGQVIARSATRGLEIKSSCIEIPIYLTFVYMILDPKA